MTASLRAIVFDLDGTLIDSRGDIAAATLHALHVCGFPELPVATLLGYVGDGARPLLARSAGIEASDARLDALYASFIEYYAAHPVVHTTLCRGAAAALSSLSGFPLGLCTNKPRSTTERVLAALGWSNSFAAVVAGGDLPLGKPDPAPMLKIASLLGVSPTELVMVGDGAQDVLSARRAHARSIGVRDGIQPLERLVAANPDLIIDDLLALPAAIQTLQTSA